jgi:hypothetical protein
VSLLLTNSVATIADDSYSEVMAALHCEEDIIVSRDEVRRSSQHGVIERKSAGSGGSEGFGVPLVDTSRIFGLTLYIGGGELWDPTQPFPSGKHGYLPEEKVKEIEYWLAKIDPEGDDGNMEAC